MNIMLIHFETMLCLRKEEKRARYRSRGRIVVMNEPPCLKLQRSADKPRSGFLDMSAVQQSIVCSARFHAWKLFAGKAGDYHAVEAYRRYPYGNIANSVGTVEKKFVPRLYFSAPIRAKEDLPIGVSQRFDYEARFNFGSGPMAADEENRVIHEWCPGMATMAGDIWSIMKEDPRYRQLCKKGNQFNHVSIHFYRAGARVREHEDRRRRGRNSMKKGTPVAVLTVGDDRILNLHRKYDSNGKTFMEEDPCISFIQEEGSVFLLHPEDETPKCRRNRYGQRKEGGVFSHGVVCPKDKDYFSVAFIFRCVETVALVNSTNDRVVPDPPSTNAERRRRMERRKIREGDNKENSPFKEEVAKVQEEWLRLMKTKNW